MLKSENKSLSIESRVGESEEFEYTGLMRATAMTQKMITKTILKPEIPAKEFGIWKGLKAGKHR